MKSNSIKHLNGAGLLANFLTVDSALSSATRRCWCVAGRVIACVLLSGCGQSRPMTYPITGKVQFDDGAPVRMGFVELRSKSTPPVNARGRIESDGSFKVGTYSADDGALAGDHEAIIIQVLSPPLLHGGQTKHERDHGAAIDTKYGDYASSGLSVSVRADEPNSQTLIVTRATQQPARHQATHSAKENSDSSP